MIIIGKSRAGPQKLGRYLDSEGENERVRLLEIRGTVAEDIRGAMLEMAAVADGTRCEKPLYHAMINPEPPNRLTDEQRMEAIEALEEKLGLNGHARVVVLHEKKGREHLHVVWSRIDLEQMRAASDSHNFRKHEEVSRDLERRFGHERVQGAHHERDGVERPDRTPSRAEWEQARRSGISGKMVEKDVTEAFRASDSPEAFWAALRDRGYTLARGDRRDYVVFDPVGGIHSLARRIDGMNAAELRKFMSPFDLASLPTVEEAKELISERERLARNSRGEARNEAAYSRGPGYVDQTDAAQKDYERRQKILNDKPKPPASTDPAERRHKDILEHYDRARRQAREQAEGGRNSSPRRHTSHFDNVEMTDVRRERTERTHSREKEAADREDWEPDRQREAPGGGRTRSR